ncbi:hypothetical protein QCA50_016562 [Cerrena zonata]|uniref:Uncharacterized protein n=1 Tax=Cerrena zonata TaxID=2478898 RepID=A0AAW0FSP8_9APHY
MEVINALITPELEKVFQWQYMRKVADISLISSTPEDQHIDKTDEIVDGAQEQNEDPKKHVVWYLQTLFAWFKASLHVLQSLSHYRR